MGFFQEFKTFATKGNVVDLATAVIIGGAFGKIVNSMVSDILMPPLGLAIGGVHFQNLKIQLKHGVEAVKEGDKIISEAVPPVTINYGAFLQGVFEFLIIAFCVFLLLKAINSLKKKEEAAPAPPPEPTKEEVLLTEIRDILAAQKKL